MKRFAKFAVVGLSGMLLAGCSIFGGNQLARSDAQGREQMASAQAVAEIYLDVGRTNLRNGNLATATRYLQGALSHPSTRAEATNAMGVVYIRLGRLDVAQRYFKQAVDLEPGNASYHTNLARIERDVSFAQLRAPTPVREAAVAVAAASVPTPRAAPVSVSPRRDASGVINIRTMGETSTAAPNMMVVERRPVVQAIQADASSAAEEATQPAEKSREYPLTIEL